MKEEENTQFAILDRGVSCCAPPYKLKGYKPRGISTRCVSDEGEEHTYQLA